MNEEELLLTQLLDEEEELLREISDRQNAVNSFADFIIYMHRDDPAFVLPLSKFQLVLCQLLEDVFYGKKQRTIINVAFSHGKSTIANKLFPSWCIGKNPHLKIVTVSHKKEYADDFSQATREYISHEKFKVIFPGIELSPDTNAKGKWKVVVNGKAGRGIYQSAGVNSGIQGVRADIVIFDDLYGGQDDARSEATRESVWRSFNSDFLTRLDPDRKIQSDILGRAVLIGSRMHIDDVTGRLIESMKNEGGIKWEIFKFPAIAMVNDILGRKPGEALWPERINIRKLQQLKNSGQFSPAMWETLYQQQPVPEGGSIIKREWWKVWGGAKNMQKLPDIETKIMSIDTAYKTEKENDYSAFTMWGIFRPPKDLWTWQQKMELIRSAANTPEEVFYEFKIPQELTKRIRAGENVPEPDNSLDYFDMGYEYRGDSENIMSRRGFKITNAEVPEVGLIPNWQRPEAYHLIALDAWQGKLPFPDLKDTLIKYINEYKPDWILVEDKGAGITLLQELYRLGINGMPYNPYKGNKITRAHMTTPSFSAGFIWGIGKPDREKETRKLIFRHGYDEFSKPIFSPSIELLVSECEVFPNGIHDDLPDTVWQVIDFVRNNLNALVIPGDVNEDEEYREDNPKERTTITWKLPSDTFT